MPKGMSARRRREQLEKMKAIWAAKRNASRKSAENDIMPMVDTSIKDGKLKTESIYHLGKQIVSVYASEGRIVRFILNDASNNSFVTTIEEA